MKTVEIYTDGACSGNPGPGGWGCVLRYGECQKEMSGYEESTTNNRMELTAAIEALGALNEPCKVELYTDSCYLAHAFQKRWLENWKRNGWLTSTKKPVENRDLWEELLRLTAIHSTRFNVVRGHAGNALNNRCDELATGAIKRNKK